jgi:streptogramin lyase
MSPADRRWLGGGGAVLVAALAFTAMRSGDDQPAPAPAPRHRAPAADRVLAAARYEAGSDAAPEIVRVARDDAVWAVLRRNGHTSLARLEGDQLREVPLYGVEPSELVPGFGRANPYLAYAAPGTVGVLRRDGTERRHVDVTGDARDVAVDRFGAVWFTDRGHAALGRWDRTKLTEMPVSTRPSPRLDEIVLQGDGSSKLWFLDERGAIGVVDPIGGGGVRTFAARGGVPSEGPSRLTASFARAAWYTTRRGLVRVSEQDGASVAVASLPAAPGAVAGGPDGNLWITARRGPWLMRVSEDGQVTRYSLDLPRNARLRDIARDTPRGDLWIACRRPSALLRVRIPELRSKLR